jgi:hypothetical protein
MRSVNEALIIKCPRKLNPVFAKELGQKALFFTLHNIFRMTYKPEIVFGSYYQSCDYSCFLVNIGYKKSES